MPANYSIFRIISLLLLFSPCIAYAVSPLDSITQWINATTSSNQTTTARFRFGVTADSGQSFGTEFETQQKINILADIDPVPEHIGKDVIFYLVAQHNQDWYMKTSQGNWVNWNSQLGNLVSYASSRKLQAIESIEVQTQLSNISGKFQIYIGYKIDNVIHYNREPFRFNVKDTPPVTQVLNAAPIADAGSSIVANEGTIIELDGSKSVDPEGSDLLYLWQQLSGPSVSLINASSAKSSFTAPQVDKTTALRFKLIVIDAKGAQATASVDVAVNDIPLCGTTEILNNQKCLTVPPVCIPPEVLQGNLCILPNRLPSATTVSAITNKDTAIDITLSGSDPDGNTLVYSKVSDPLHGSVTLIGNIAHYIPAKNYQGPDSFSYKVNDGKVDSPVANVSISVSSTNKAPSATAISVSTDEDIAKDILLSGSDPEGDTLTYRKATDPLHGSVTLIGNTAHYIPTENYNGQDSFSYVVNDGSLDSAPANVNITLAAVNDAPTANLTNATTNEDIAKFIQLSGSDPEGDTLTFSKVTNPTHGSVSLSGSIANYTPATDYQGSDSFTFKVNDGKLDSVPAAVSINVSALNDAPVSNPGTAKTKLNTQVTITLLGSDPEGAALTYSKVNDPLHGSVNITANKATYTPTSSYIGTDSFNFKVNDGVKDSAPATISIEVESIYKLNDTGIRKCFEGAVTGQVGQNCPLAQFPGQDGDFGRDATENNNSDGHAGFNFYKISNIGQALVASAVEWNCVKDNVTGLMWEVKTDNQGLHDKDWYYTWYEPDSSKNGNDPGLQNGGSCGNTSRCDTYAYVQAVNTATWCGHNDWRLPTIEELKGITALDRDAPMIDTAYFPNTEAVLFWSSSSSSELDSHAWMLNSNGSGGLYVKTTGARVRLVRNAQ